MQDFPTKLRLLREHRGLSQRRLADELGFSNVHLGYLESGKRKPTGEMVLKLSRFFGVTPNDLLLDEIEIDFSEQ